MRKKVSVGLLFLVPVLSYIFIYLVKTQNKPVNGGNFENEMKFTSARNITTSIVSVNPTPVIMPQISELMAELKSGETVIEDEKLLSLAKEESALGYYSNLILANRYEKEGKDASGYYRAALELYYTDEIHFRLASSLLKNGKIQEAEKEYLSLLPDENSLQVLKKMNTNLEKICEAYINKKGWNDLEELLKPVFEKDSDENANNPVLMEYYAQTLAELGDFKNALPFLKKLYELYPENLNIAWYYALCLESTGQTDNAAKIYSSIGEKGAYRYGLILQNQGRSMEAADIFAASNEAASLWQAARIWDAAGMTEKAIDTYNRIASIASSYQDDAAYRAYILSKRIGKDDVDKLMDVISFYPAWMVRIGEEPVFPQLEDITYQRPEYLKQAAIYEDKGYRDAAAVEVAIGSKETSLEEKLALGDWYMEHGDYYNAILWGVKSLNEQPTRKGYELAYPQVFRELVLDASEKYNVEPELIWAIIREESHFRYDAVSRTGALGLMQIMPSTGKDIASCIGITVTDDDLLNPGININLGTFYINSMLNMFNRNIDEALAAYNGGPENVKKWLKSSIMTSEEDFTTAVAFQETREYITKVRNTYLIYKWLYN